MNWKFWTWPRQWRDLEAQLNTKREQERQAWAEVARLETAVREATRPPTLVLHGWSENQMRQAFLTAPDNDLLRGTLEQCDKLLMETVNELVNQADAMTDGLMRQRIGQLRGITELRELLEQRTAQARLDQQALQQDQTPKEEN
jgi:hypothetical protein